MVYKPIVKDDWVKEGSLFIHIGTYVEEEYESLRIPIRRVVDYWEGTKHRKTQVLECTKKVSLKMIIYMQI